MTNEQVIEKITELAADTSYIVKRATELLNSGAVEPADYDNDYELPKYLMCAALEDFADQMRPFTSKGKKVIANLRHF